MVRNYVRKKPAPKWKKSHAEKAVKAVLNNEMTLTAASEKFKIPLTCLHRRVKSAKDNQNKEVAGPSQGSFKPVFNEEQEKILREYILQMERVNFT